jgi:hypothetical protein
MPVRARMFVQQVARNAGDTATVTLQAVSRGKENSEWSKYTPSGSVNLTLTREASAAFAYFNDRVGKEVFVDIGDAEDPICTQCGEPIAKNETGGQIRGGDGAYLHDEYVHALCDGAAKVRLGLA